jgi:hypothetical protein
MVDQEVEQTLREIRERVRAAAPPQVPGPPAPAREGAAAHATDAAASPYAADAGASLVARGGSFESLARMEANLSTTERAWSRLPPVLSYRRGALARFELAVKRLVKRALHWFTWEQVNFNSAAHHALRDALAALSAHERHLAEARAELDALCRRASEVEARAEAERARQEGTAERRHGELRAELERTRGELRAELERLGAGLRELQNQMRTQLHDELRTELGGELREALGGELRDRVEHLADEQRVCFRQLSLEATEAAVAHDRARRLVEARLDELEKAVNSES